MCASAGARTKPRIGWATATAARSGRCGTYTARRCRLSTNRFLFNGKARERRCASTSSTGTGARAPQREGCFGGTRRSPTSVFWQQEVGHKRRLKAGSAIRRGSKWNVSQRRRSRSGDGEADGVWSPPDPWRPTDGGDTGGIKGALFQRPLLYGPLRRDVRRALSVPDSPARGTGRPACRAASCRAAARRFSGAASRNVVLSRSSPSLRSHA